MNGARTLLSGLLRLEQWGCALAFAVMVGVLGIDILGREVFGGGKIWATPIAVYANVFMAFVGMGIASAGGAHLRPKFFDQAVPRSWDGMFNRFTDIGFALFAAAACVLCWKLVRETMSLAETDAVLQWQVWPFQWFLIVAFAFAGIRHACYATWPSLRPQPALEP